MPQFLAPLRSPERVTGCNPPRAFLPDLLRLLALLPCAAMASAAPAIAPAAAPGLAAAPPDAPRLESVASDPANVSEYLAYWQAMAYRRSLLSARPATLNQSAYDVRYYDLDLHPDISAKSLSGTVRMIAAVLTGPLTSVDMDLDGLHMQCDAATSGGTATTFVQTSGLLTLQLDRSYATGEVVNVTVQYHGVPTGGAFGAAFGFDLHNGSTLVSTLSEPFAARTWWPCKDDPADKPDSVDVRVTMPSGYVTASNGVLVESTGNGTTRYVHWHERHPIATYLVSIASFPYSVYSDWYRPTPTDSMEIRFHLFPEAVTPTSAVHAKVKTMIAGDVIRYGPYPFVDEKYGHAQVLFGGGMENQTCTSLGSFGEYVVAHELSHQWWGDAVTCRDFHHIWLNEGFATFSEAVWAEVNGGIDAFHARINSDTTFVPGTIYVPDLSDPSRIFSSNLSYRKPAWVLAMLRHLLGDATFYLAMRTYLQQHYYGTAVTEDFQAACEQVSGRNLSKFFQQWIYGEYYPKYRLTASWVMSAGGGYDVSVQIQQVQSWKIFWTPIDVRVSTGSGSFDFVAQDSTALQVFTFHVPSQPTSVALDPDRWVLRESTTSGLDVPVMPGSVALELSAPHPNPARRESAIEFTTPGTGRVDIDVLDAAGRRVARLQRGELPAGRHQVDWGGVDDAGHAVRPGFYWFRLEFQGQRLARPIALFN